ncbi:MAG: hypothetical protein RIC19_15145 [Phaeodactylibacter sp.]|uniref:WD40/YVTN/BNR-like repeat-containing protein n=1 Tax=Phaeodactylibacter sp. TaxID=1940289 RepID=UPI0032EC6711
MKGHTIKNILLLSLAAILLFSACDDDGFNFDIAECKPEAFLDNWALQVILPNISTNFLPQLNNVDFTTTDIGYAAGELGTLIRISGNGTVWEVQLTGQQSEPLTEQSLLSVDFFAEDQGFAGGSDILPQFSEERDSGAVFLSTADAGVTWSRQYHSDIRRFMDLEFYNPLLGLALVLPDDADTDSDYSIARTEDGGATWSVEDLPEDFGFPRFQRANNRIFIPMNRRFYFSDDRGETWTERSAPVNSIEVFYFVTPETGFAIGETTAFKTTDGGQNWDQIPLPVQGGGGIMHFADENQGFFLRSVIDQEPETGINYLSGVQSLETQDGGNTWTVVSEKSGCLVNGEVTFPSSVIGYVVNPNTVYRFIKQ